MSAKDIIKSPLNLLGNASLDKLISSLVEREKTKNNLSTEDAIDVVAIKLELIDLHEQEHFNLGFFKDFPDGSVAFVRPDFRIEGNEKEGN